MYHFFKLLLKRAYLKEENYLCSKPLEKQLFGRVLKANKQVIGTIGVFFSTPAVPGTFLSRRLSFCFSPCFLFFLCLHFTQFKCLGRNVDRKGQYVQGLCKPTFFSSDYPYQKVMLVLQKDSMAKPMWALCASRLLSNKYFKFGNLYPHRI